MPAKKTTTTSMIYQLKITLKDSKPPIWRRIQVKDDIGCLNRPSAVDRFLDS